MPLTVENTTLEVQRQLPRCSNFDGLTTPSGAERTVLATDAALDALLELDALEALDATAGGDGGARGGEGRRDGVGGGDVEGVGEGNGQEWKSSSSSESLITRCHVNSKQPVLYHLAVHDTHAALP